MITLPVCSNLGKLSVFKRKNLFLWSASRAIFGPMLRPQGPINIYYQDNLLQFAYAFICKNSLYKTSQVISILVCFLESYYSNVVPGSAVFMSPGSLSAAENLSLHPRLAES